MRHEALKLISLFTAYDPLPNTSRNEALSLFPRLGFWLVVISPSSWLVVISPGSWLAVISLGFWLVVISLGFWLVVISPGSWLVVISLGSWLVVISLGSWLVVISLGSWLVVSKVESRSPAGSPLRASVASRDSFKQKKAVLPIWPRGWWW